MTKRKDISILKEQFNKTHNQKYDYSLVDNKNYKNMSSKLPIICHCKDIDGKEHGTFYQDGAHHLRGHGCPKCCKNGIKYTTEEFIKNAKNKNQSLLFDKCNYINAHTNVEVGCLKHGYFKIRPYLLLQNHGSPYCGNERADFLHSLTLNEFIERANIVHSNKYDYSKSVYKNNSTKINIICPKHGEFLQRPNNHLRGEGCPKCKESKLEKSISKNFPNFERQKTFEWLVNISNLYIDFYDDITKIGIECQGEQHFSDKNFFENFYLTKERDSIKYELCKNNGIKIIYYFPKDFLKYKDSFYNDKECYHTIKELKDRIYGKK